MTEIYLYQTLHLNRGGVRNLAEHIRLLDEASRELFGCGYTPQIPQLARRIAALAQREGYPQGVSGFIRLELLADGSERLLPAGVSLYDGYALRSLTPRAATSCYTIPAQHLPTSAREAAAQLARTVAERLEASAVVQCTEEGVCRTADDAPLFAVKGRQAITPPLKHPENSALRLAPWSVERTLGIEAARAAGLEVTEAVFRADELSAFDELFYIDHRGITALSHCNGIPYMSLMAERTAEALEGLFRKA